MVSRRRRMAYFTEFEAAVDFIRTAGAPLVVKADGLAAGKGVLICATRAEAEDAVHSVLVDRAFQAAGDRVVIEAFLEGEELSVIAVVDGERIACCPRHGITSGCGTANWARTRAAWAVTRR